MNSSKMYKVEIMNPSTDETTFKFCKNAIEIVKSVNNELFSGIDIVTPAIIYSTLTRKSRVKVPYGNYFIIHPKAPRDTIEK